MSKDGKVLFQSDDTISTEEDIPGSSISFSIGDNSIRVKEKPKPQIQKSTSPPVVQKKEQWWLKKPAPQVELSTQNEAETEKAATPLISPDINSSMKDFLDKEKMCKNNEINIKDKDDTLQNILASVAFDKCQSDFENGTDEDIENILEEMSKIAGTMSPVQDSIKSKSINEILSEEEHSVEKLLEEAEKLVQENGNNLMEDLNTNEIVIPDENDTSEGLTRVKQLEVDIFKMIEQQANDNIHVNSDKQRSLSPSIELMLAEDTQKTLESQKKKFVEQKVEVSSSSDLDDPIERHSMSEEINDQEKSADKKENLKKEITDVDKDFFDALLMKTKENAEQLSSRSSSFDKEDFTNFLKLLQEQSDKESKNIKHSTSNLASNQYVSLKETSTKKENAEFMEKELVSLESKKIVYELESPVCQPSSTAASKMEKLLEESLRKDSSRKSSKDSSKRSSTSSKSLTVDTKKGINNKNELYNVGLTPRLELFADAIPKLLAEKTNETNIKKNEDEKEKSEREKQTTPKFVDDNEDFSFKNFKALDVLKHTEVLKDHKNVTDVKDFKGLMDFKASQIGDHHQSDLHDFNYLQDSVIFTEIKTSNNHLKTERVVSAPENGTLRETFIGKSRSYDQFSKPTNKFSSSLENVRHMKVSDNRKTTSTNVAKKTSVPKTKIQSKTVSKINAKTKVMSKSKKDPVISQQNNINLDVKGSQVRSNETVGNTSDGGDWKSGETLEMLYQEERQRFLHIKAELEAEVEAYKLRLKDVQMLHEQEMFALKKQNILLKSKVDEFQQLNKVKTMDVRLKYDPKMISMQRELDRQENLIRAYESENKKLIQETKQLQSEMKVQALQKPKVLVTDNSNNNQLQEKFKDLQEESFKLNLELSNLRQKNGDLSLKYEDVTQQNCLLQEELEMIKDQLRAKNDFITDRLQAMTTNELELRKQVEDLKVELHSKTEQLKGIKVDYDRFQESVAPLEKEVDILRTKCSYYQEKLQTAKNNCEREKHLTQKLKDQVILDNKNIMDLNRQVREMERILKRKNPDSVSALILTANSENEKLSVEKVKLLEERIAFLESEIRSKEDSAQSKLTEIQQKFANMKEKYSMQVVELEQRLKSTPRERERERKVYAEIGTQTLHTSLEANLTNKAGPKSQNPKEDTHLLATIRGLKVELANKEKATSRVNKELQELQKTNRRLQKERERLLNERKNTSRAMFGSDSKLASTRATEAYDPNSNLCPNGHLPNGKKISTSTQRLYNDTAENGENNARLKRLSSENEVLKEELSRLNKDFVALKNKRLQDLNLLQAEHEKEIALITEECSVKTRDNKALKLQGQVNSQMAMISRLKQQIETLEDYKEQVIILKAERDHLERNNRTLNEKVKYLSTPSSQQLQLLQEKITILQQRHESRELSLQKLVRDLLRSRSQSCRDCKSVIGGKQQLCYFRQELDNILGTLQDLTSP